MSDIVETTHVEVAEDMIFGGFFLTAKVVAPKLERIPPDDFLTVSKCLGEFVPDDWVYWNSEGREKERIERARALGINVEFLEEIKALCTVEYLEKKSIGYPNVIYDIDTAKAIVGKVSRGSTSSLSLLGIGLPFVLSGQFFERLKKFTSGSKEIALGIPSILQRGSPLPEGGILLGYDALGYEPQGTFHSSKCFRVDESSLAGIRFNQSGYCCAFSDAARLSEILSEGGSQETIWLPWEIRKYSL